MGRSVGLLGRRLGSHRMRTRDVDSADNTEIEMSGPPLGLSRSAGAAAGAAAAGRSSGNFYSIHPERESCTVHHGESGMMAHRPLLEGVRNRT